MGVVVEPFDMPPAANSAVDAHGAREREPRSSHWSQQLPPTVAKPSPAKLEAPPFYWVPTEHSFAEFEVSGACGEVVGKVGDYDDKVNSLPIAGTLKMLKGGLYFWTLQVVRQCPHRPEMQFGLHGPGHSRPWRLVSTSRCSRARDDGVWLPRPRGDLAIIEGDLIHCEVDLRGLQGAKGSFAFAVNEGAFESAFEDIPISDVDALQPVVAMGGHGSCCRVCPA